MKYVILGFQQQKLIENDLSVEDAFILRTIKDMYSSSSMVFKDIDGIKYMWINYTYFLEQIPIIGSKRSLMRKIEFYGNEKFLLRVLEKQKDGVKGNYSYIAPTEKLDRLQDFDLMSKTHKVGDKDVQTLRQDSINLMTESHNKDTSIIDTSIKENINSLSEHLWSLYPSKINKRKAFDKIPKLVEKYGYEQLVRCIERYKTYVNNERAKGFKTLNYQNGSTFFNGRYEDYLDKNYTDPKSIIIAKEMLIAEQQEGGINFE